MPRSLGPWNVWEATSSAVDDFTRRARGEVEFTYARQTAAVLAPFIAPGTTLLDAGCGTGHLFHALNRRGLPVEYFGIDVSPRFIEIGQREMAGAGLAPDRLRVQDIAQIERSYDIVVCLNTLCFLPDYRVYLDRLCQATDRVLLIRASLADATNVQYVVDGVVDPPHQDMKLYFNTYAIAEVTAFIGRQGFTVRHLKDEYTQDGPETVVGKTLYRKMLLCERSGGMP